MANISLDDWFFHIKKIHQQRTDTALDRFEKIADRLRLRTFSCPVITIGGTNGKGSCAKTLESIYSAAGYKTGLYTSPHLMHFNERIRVGNSDIDDATLQNAFEMVEHARQEVVLSFFEFITAAALVVFQQSHCDVIILEVGLGGRLDAVNVVESDVAVLTSIDLDHMNLLGDTREKIADEKVQIARTNKPFVCGDEDPPSIIATTLQQKKSHLHQLNRDFFYQQTETDFTCWGSGFSYSLPRPHLKPQNIAIAIKVIEILKPILGVTEACLQHGIRDTFLSGRFEKIDAAIPCIMDVAHNPAASTWLAEQYASLPKTKTVAIVGMLKDKDMIETITPLIPWVDTWFICDLSHQEGDRGSDGIVMAEFLKTKGIKNCYTFPTVTDAMHFLRTPDCQQEHGRALIFGSFAVVAAAKKLINETQGDETWKKKQNND